ncbi:O-acetyl-ADP-ribose deacetylase (regulator of RNase III) [Oligosphaera ethanolica]|uniref:O-acetyl-ADP-ribose deacetylase (Regulator of RNase III) n=1 Tax=Oligosphaera ethanolica TaxID=760260 RepID=A0AAE3VE45_9BACT|nr:O-acetyl-ADP-ribose deacetylase (regulator of RNase III) [Oligosphaera ethanolica]
MIHTPGPVYQDGEHGEAALLANSYANSLQRAEEKQCQAIAFPCISTGVYGYPKEAAAEIALATVKTFPARSVKKVIFCCFSSANADIYNRLVALQK